MVDILKDPDGWRYLDGFGSAAVAIRTHGISAAKGGLLPRVYPREPGAWITGRVDGYLSAFGLEEKVGRETA